MSTKNFGKHGLAFWMILGAVLTLLPRQDMSLFAQTLAEAEQLYVDVKINDQSMPGIFHVVIKNKQLLMARDQVSSLQLKNSLLFEQQDIFQQTFSVIPNDITYELNREKLEINLIVPRDYLPESVFGNELRHVTVSPKTYAVYWNYHLSVFHNPFDKFALFEGAHKPVLATPFGAFVNQFITNLGPTNAIVRLETAYEIDLVKNELRITAGDFATDAPTWAHHVAMAGIKVQKNFLFQRGLLSYPTVSLSGFAPRNGEAQIWLNESLRESKELPRGGFLLDNLNLPAGAHKGVLVVRDQTGIASETPFSYYADPQLLRANTQAFSYSLGFLRIDYGSKSFSYGVPLFFGNHKFGATNFWSPAVHVELSTRQLMAGSEQRFRLWNFGSTALASAFSWSSTNHGYLLSDEVNLNFFRVLTSAHAQWSSSQFEPVGATKDIKDGATFLLSNSLRLDLPYIDQTSLGYLLVHRKIPRLHALSLKQGLPFFDKFALNVQGEYDFLSGNATIFAFIGTTLPYRHQLSAQGQASGTNLGGAASLSMSPDSNKDTRFAYNASGGYEKFTYGQGDMSVDTKYVISRVSSFVAKNKFHYMGELNGSFGGIRDELFIARPIDNGIFLIEMPEQKNIRVWQDKNVNLGTTDEHGRLVVTSLRALEEAQLGFDARDFNITTRSSSSSQEVTVTPGLHSAHHISLSAPIVRNIEFRLLKNNSVLPSGTYINLIEQDSTFVMSNGTIYVEIPKDQNAIRGMDESGECRFAIELPRKSSTVLEKIGDVHCE